MKSNLSPLIILLVGSSWVAASEPSSEQADTLLRGTSHPPHVAYHGRMTVTHWYDHHTKSEEISVQFRPPQYYRWEYIKPDGQMDRVIITDGTDEQILLVQKKKILQGRAAKSATKILTSDREWDLLKENYGVALKGTELMAGRSAWILELTPTTEEKANQRIWIDKETGVVLRLKRFRPGGKLAALSQFIQFETGSPAPMDRFQMSSSDDEHAEEHGYDPDFYSLEEFSKHKPHRSTMPHKLPLGFEFESVDTFIVDGHSVDHFRYTDGLSVVSIFETSLPVRLHPQERAKFSIPFFGPDQIQTNETGHVLTTHSKGIHFTLVGDISENALRSIGAAIK